MSVSKATILDALTLCGNGPMVLILPDEIWYRRVRAEEAIEIMNRAIES